jgi:hypothetical protein
VTLEPAQKGIESAFIDVHTVLGHGLTQGVAVLLLAQSRQNGYDQAATAEFQAEIFEGFRTHWVCTVFDIVCDI